MKHSGSRAVTNTTKVDLSASYDVVLTYANRNTTKTIGAVSMIYCIKKD